MNLLQRLFDRLIGFAQYDDRLHHDARRIYATPGIDASAFDKPACWRRSGVRARGRQPE